MSKSATKSDLILRVAAKIGGNQKQAGQAIDAVIQAISDTLSEGESLTLKGFGSFDVKERQEREGRNPKTGESITIPACNTIRFSPSDLLKGRVN